MLQRFLFIALTLCSLSATAQWQQTGSKVRYVNGLGIPTKDTAAGVAADSSQIVIRPADSALYIKYKRTWLRVGGGGGSIAGSGTTNYIPKFTSATAIGNSSIFDNGNVGIGTASPSYKLDINNVGGSTATSRLYGNDQSNVRLRLENIGTSGRTWEIVGGLPGANNSNFSIQDVSSAATRMTIDASGNIGIGTTSPAAKLHVTGDGLFANPSNAFLKVNSTSGISVLELTNAAGSQYIYGGAGGSNNIDFYTNSIFRMRISANGNALINTTTDNGVDKLQVSGSMNVSANATVQSLSVTNNATVGGNLIVTGTGNITGTLSGSTFSPSQLNAGSVNSSSYLSGKALTLAYTNISATYTTVASTDYFINVTTGTFTINLHTAATPVGMILVIKNSGTGTVTLDANGSQTIDGNTTITMNVQNQTYTLMSDGSNWKVISKYL